ncbi:hypothetical protein [Nitrosomonas sp. Nm33]|uniref:hypothetical protein n=1 Tax=Nitrosomonas sp. Nm33 TaxID=133724 RepID=UPI00089C5F1F|nr:hypothetical protein [Nitrosomonas sp. Nm33]SDY98672.1 hypothetical protein SAMN05421755_10778 [Nitrosomonas sp. Nm33]
MDNSNNSGRIMLSGVKIILIASFLFLTGCMAVRTKPTAPIDLAETTCRALYQEIDTVIDNAGVRDYGSSSVEGFPYLRTTRLLASFSHELNDESLQWSAWIGHMANLDAQARASELRNLPSSVTEERKEALLQELNSCRDRLIKTDLTKPKQRARLRERVHVPDDYVTWWQVVGLYPLTAPIVGVGISRWHRKTHDVFATPLALLPVEGKLVRWVPLSLAIPNATDAWLSDKSPNTHQISEILYRSLDPLGIPLPTADELNQLFDTFAPIWEVDVVDENDRIGMMHWQNGPIVDTTRPILYRRVSHTRFGNQVLLQLNYIVWFRARPGNDIYAGLLDGINWRVTLGSDGKPLLYDAIHNCGCYHKFFLSDQLRLRKDLPFLYFESPLLPQPAPEQLPLVLRIAHQTHFIQRVYHDSVFNGQSSAGPASQSMMWEDYDVLRSLPSDEGYHSLFSTYGLITGTERFERFILWPMGIRSPGGMRQWGRHATAFNGRRHFDDAFLIESLFEKVP